MTVVHPRFPFMLRVLTSKLEASDMRAAPGAPADLLETAATTRFLQWRGGEYHITPSLMSFSRDFYNSWRDIWPKDYQGENVSIRWFVVLHVGSGEAVPGFHSPTF